MILWVLAAYLYESALLAYTGPALLGARLNRSRVLSIAVAHAALIIVIRKVYGYLGIPLGSHTFILIAVLAVLLRYMGSVPLGIGIGGAIASLILLLLGDTVMLLLPTSVVTIDWEQVWEQPALWLLVNFVNKLVLLAVALVVHFGNFDLFTVFRRSGRAQTVESNPNEQEKPDLTQRGSG